jgi:hypothetical protein
MISGVALRFLVCSACVRIVTCTLLVTSGMSSLTVQHSNLCGIIFLLY